MKGLQSYELFPKTEHFHSKRRTVVSETGQLTYMTIYFHWFGPTPDRLFCIIKKCDAESVNPVKAF